jgi:hypothetical protein
MTRKSITRLLNRVVTVGALVSIGACSPVAADLIVDGDFEACRSGKDLRVDNKGQDWRETRKDGDGRALLKLSTKDIGGNATHKAMIKADAELNTYLTQKLASEQKDDFTVKYDIYVRKILSDDNRSAFFLVGNSSDRKRGPNSTGAERFVFLGFENAEQEGKINLFAREGNKKWEDKTMVAGNLELKKWYTITVSIHVKKKTYEVSVDGVTEPVTVKAFGKKPPKELSHVSFASWDDGAGTFYVDNVIAQ